MRTLLLFLLLVVAPAGLVSWHAWDSSQNRGFEFGYYGTFNRVRHSLEGMTGVSIAREWANEEIFYLEEFGFLINTQARQAVSLGFSENDPIRDLSGDALTRALATKIDATIASAKRQP